MKIRIQLAAMALAAALAISGSPQAHADDHNQQAPSVVDGKYIQYLRSLPDKELRKLIVRLKVRSNSNDQKRTHGFRERARQDRLAAARQERTRRQSGATTPSQPSTAVKLTKNERRARNLLNGATDARSLRSPALENRIKSARKLLKRGGLQDKTQTRLSGLLSGDRAELQGRQPAVQPVSGSERQALRLMKGAPSASLRASALQERIRTGRNLLASDEFTNGTKRRLRQFVANDRADLQSRQANQQADDLERRARRHLRNAVVSEQLGASALRDRIRQSNEFLSARSLRRSTRKGLTKLIRADRAALDRIAQQAQPSSAERRARELLRTSVSPDKLKGSRLRERVKETRSLLREPEISRRTRRKLQARLESDLAELQTRSAGQATESYADQQARKLLNDTRPAANLREPRLRRRLDETRDLLQDQQLSQQYSRQLRRRLKADRRELRRRVEASRTGDTSSGIEAVIGSTDAASRLLSDRRPSSALQAKQLSRRVRQTQQLLNGGGLSNYDRSVLTDMLRSDRRELRQRLRARRDRRRLELDRKRRNNDINIVIAPQIEFAPRNDVAAAEADDEAIERQLIAPPTRQVDRRYSLDEFRRRPDLRNYMPAVEVDSIRFGTNEHFVREEEIDELERIGEIIERVVTANPGEVFMIEGHTDAVGSDGYNLALSTKRAEAVKEALLEFFVIKRENLATIGYGERFLKIPTREAEQENRRVSVRRITPLLSSR